MQRSPPLLLLSLVLGGLLLSSCAVSGPAGTSAGASSRRSAFSSSLAVEIMMPESSSVQDEARVVRVEVSNWAFTPPVITAKVGEKVTLTLVGVSGNHGLLAPDLGLDVKVNEGETVSVELSTDRPGTFPFRCNVFCGEGHKDMTGAITIAE